MDPVPRTHHSQWHYLRNLPVEIEEGFQEKTSRVDFVLARIVPIQGGTQHSGWSDSMQKQDCYPITTTRTDPRQPGFGSFLISRWEFSVFRRALRQLLQTWRLSAGYARSMRSASRMVLRLPLRSQSLPFSASVRKTSITRAAITWSLWTASLVGRLCINPEIILRFLFTAFAKFSYFSALHTNKFHLADLNLRPRRHRNWC